jgi:hypothetical protein
MVPAFSGAKAGFSGKWCFLPWENIGIRLLASGFPLMKNWPAILPLAMKNALVFSFPGKLQFPARFRGD